MRRKVAELLVHVTWVRREGLFPLADDPWQDLDFATRMTRPAHLVGRTSSRPTSRSPPPRSDCCFQCRSSTTPCGPASPGGSGSSVRTTSPRRRTPPATGPRSSGSRRATHSRTGARSPRSPEAISTPPRRSAGGCCTGGSSGSRRHTGPRRSPTCSTPVAAKGSIPAQRTPEDEGTLDDRGPFSARRIAGLLWALRADPSFLARTDRAGRAAVDGRTACASGCSATCW